MIMKSFICDICGKDMKDNKPLPYKFSTNNIKHAGHVLTRESPSISVSSMEYLHYCGDCLAEVIHAIAKEQGW